MRATEGAIEGVILTDRVELQVIGGDITPKGICGSGLVDTVAQLRVAGLVDVSGRMRSREEVPEHPLSDRLIMVDGVQHVGADTYWWGGNLSAVTEAPV